MPRTNLDYAHEFFGVETLEARNSDHLDFHDVSIASVHRFIEAVSIEDKLSLSTNKEDKLIHDNLWDEGGNDTIIRHSDRLDFHDVSIGSITRFITAVRAA